MSPAWKASILTTRPIVQMTTRKFNFYKLGFFAGATRYFPSAMSFLPLHVAPSLWTSVVRLHYRYSRKSHNRTIYKKSYNRLELRCSDWIRLVHRLNYYKWSIRGSNPPSSGCKPDGTPLRLIPHILRCTVAGFEPAHHYHCSCLNRLAIQRL